MPGTRGGVLVVGLAGWLLSACERVGVTPVPSDEEVGRDYFPMAVGRYWEYDVREVAWDNNDSTTTQFALRERVDTVFRGAAGDLTYRVVRGRRAAGEPQWREDSVFAIIVTPELVRRTFANRPYVELQFPVREGRSWNPAMFQPGDSTERRYEHVDQPLTLPTGLQFARTVQAAEPGEDNLFYLREYRDTYARGVGRVRRVRRTLDFCQYTDSANTGCSIGVGYVVRGREREELLRAYGSTN